jgi:MFS family permease
MNGRGSPGSTANNARYGLSVLFVVALFNHLDRSIVSILQEPLKADLGLTDLQLGMLTGLAFALLYATLAVPMGRIADRVSRPRLMAFALLLWSAMTALSGLATGFAALVVLRMGVALGEACCTPTSMSLISDYYPARRRGLPIAIWSIAVPVGTVLGFVAGGWISEVLSWRAAFAWVGLAGIVFAPFVLSLREPPRGQFDRKSSSVDGHSRLPLSEAFSVLWRLRSCRFLILAGALQSFVLCATQNWSAPFYARIHDLDMGEVVQFLVVLFGLGGGIGALLGGAMVDRLSATDVRWYAWLPGLAAFMTVPFGLVQFMAETPAVSLCAGFVTVICAILFMAPLNAATQSLVPSSMRGFTSACVLVVTNVVGLGLGPLAVGGMSDYLIGLGVADLSLRYALSMGLMVSLLSGCAYFFAARFLTSEWPDASTTILRDRPREAAAMRS